MRPSNHKSILENISLALSGWELSWKGILDNRKGEWWLIGQIILITAHLSPHWPLIDKSNYNYPLAFKLIGFILLFSGITLIIRAFLHLGESLSPLPDPKPGAKLITTGAYRQCRHPLYQGLVIASVGLSILYGSIFHILLSISLCTLLRGKAQREERKLKAIHPEYREYILNTPAIIPSFRPLDWRN